MTSAAIAGFTRFDKITLDEWNRYLAVNLTGTFLCIRAALSDMVAGKWGSHRDHFIGRRTAGRAGAGGIIRRRRVASSP